MDYEILVSYEDIADRLEYHEVLVSRMWERLHQFKRECRRVLNISEVRTKRCLGSGGPLEMEFCFHSPDSVPCLRTVSALVDAYFDHLDFPVTFCTFASCRNPDSDEFTHHGFRVQIAYWSFSEN